MEIEFKTYTGTKTIKASPMGAGEARRYGANLSDDTVLKSIGVHGYLVEYADGYRSWSPAKVFRESYKVAETHVDRMKIELADLNERICSLTRAIYTIEAIPYDERWLLENQLKAMREYAGILYQRITIASEPCCNAASTKGGA